MNKSNAFHYTFEPNWLRSFLKFITQSFILWTFATAYNIWWVDEYWSQFRDCKKVIIAFCFCADADVVFVWSACIIRFNWKQVSHNDSRVEQKKKTISKKWNILDDDKMDYIFRSNMLVTLTFHDIFCRMSFEWFDPLK